MVHMDTTHKDESDEIRSDEETDEDEDVLDYKDDDDIDSSDEEEDEDLVATNDDLDWKKGGWAFSGDLKPLEPQVHIDFTEGESKELDTFLQFLPIDYIVGKVIPNVNIYARRAEKKWHTLTFSEFLRVLGILYSMEVCKLMEWSLYWEEEDMGIFPAMKYGRFIEKQRLEDIMHYLQIVFDDDDNEQILQLIDAVNLNFQQQVTAGDVLVVENSLVKTFYMDWEGGLRMTRNTHINDAVFKTVCDAKSQVVLHLDLYETDRPKSKKKNAPYSNLHTTLKLVDNWKNSGRMVVGDSSFGSVKAAVELMRTGLNSTFIVSKDCEDYPHKFLKDDKLDKWEWKSATASIEGVDLLAVKYKGSYETSFITTCSCSSAGPPKSTIVHGHIPRPRIAVDYVDYASTVKIHKRIRVDPIAFDIWPTKDPQMHQFASILCFVLTNSFLALKHFRGPGLKFIPFKMALTESLIDYKNVESNEKAHCAQVPQPTQSGLHVVKKFTMKSARYQRKCFYCQHGRSEPIKKNTSYYCLQCGEKYPLCSPTVRDCFMLHELHGMPAKRRVVKNK